MPPRVLASGPKPCGGNKEQLNSDFKTFSALQTIVTSLVSFMKKSRLQDSHNHLKKKPDS